MGGRLPKHGGMKTVDISDRLFVVIGRVYDVLHGIGFQANIRKNGVVMRVWFDGHERTADGVHGEMIAAGFNMVIAKFQEV